MMRWAVYRDGARVGTVMAHGDQPLAGILKGALEGYGGYSLRELDQDPDPNYVPRRAPGAPTLTHMLGRPSGDAAAKP